MSYCFYKSFHQPKPLIIKHLTFLSKEMYKNKVIRSNRIQRKINNYKSPFDLILEWEQSKIRIIT